MQSAHANLLATVLALPARERARIAHELVLSLDEGADADAAEAWVAKLQQRARDARSVAVATEDWGAVRALLTDRWRPVGSAPGISPGAVHRLRSAWFRALRAAPAAAARLQAVSKPEVDSRRPPWTTPGTGTHRQ